MVVGVILAGGLSSRMGGGDKGLVVLGQRPMLAFVVDRLGPQVDRLALSANGDAARFSDFGLPVIGDAAARRGPLAGVLAGLEWAAGLGAAAVVTAPCDAPFLPLDLVARLVAAADAAGVAAAIAATPGAAGREPHPTCGLWPVAAREALRAGLDSGLRRVRDFAAALDAATAVFPEPAAFFNVNRPNDLVDALKRLEERP